MSPSIAEDGASHRGCWRAGARARENKYFLLTHGWASNTGRLIVLPDSATIRAEFGT